MRSCPNHVCFQRHCPAEPSLPEPNNQHLHRPPMYSTSRANPQNAQAAPLEKCKNSRSWVPRRRQPLPWKKETDNAQLHSKLLRPDSKVVKRQTECYSMEQFNGIKEWDMESYGKVELIERREEGIGRAGASGERWIWRGIIWTDWLRFIHLVLHNALTSDKQMWQIPWAPSITPSKKPKPSLTTFNMTGETLNRIFEFVAVGNFAQLEGKTIRLDRWPVRCR